MPRIVREADVAWEGNLARGHGALTAATSGAFIGLSYSLPTRVGDSEGKTSPEELLAAAHGGCFTMSLAGELTGAGTPRTFVAGRAGGRGGVRLPAEAKRRARSASSSPRASASDRTVYG